MPHIDPLKPSAEQDPVKPAKVKAKDAVPGNDKTQQLPTSGRDPWSGR
jgi:hypothetical protein